MHRRLLTISTPTPRSIWRGGMAIALAGALVACVSDSDNPTIPLADAAPDALPGHDAGAYDAGSDATIVDAAADAADATIEDAAIDAGHDANVPDAHVADSNVPDTNVPDTNVPDTNVPDTNTPDVSIADAGSADSNVPDTSIADAAVDSAGPPPGGLGPTAYLSFADSPFKGNALGYFYLEDFEDHLLNTPGVSANGQSSTSSTTDTSLIDSVDGDDGDPTDGKCVKDGGLCDAWFSGSGPSGITFTFDAQALGALPTHVGIVWTDGGGTVLFRAYDAAGALIGSVGPSSDPPNFPDNSFYGTTGEDRFFGGVYPGGVQSITISNTSGGIEADHLQYGR